MANQDPKIQIQNKLNAISIPGDKLSKDLFSLSTEDYQAAGDWLGIIENPKAKECRQVETYYRLRGIGDYDTPPGMIDLLVLSVCTTAYQQGIKAISLRQIARYLMHGNTSDRQTSNPTEDLIEVIETSLRRLMTTVIDIDLSDTAKRLKYGFQRTKITAPLLPCKIDTYNVNGQPDVRVVSMFSQSPIFEVAEYKRQILSIAAKLFDVAKLGNTPQIITLKGYLLSRIAAIKQHRKNLSHFITFKDVYARIGATEAPKSSKQSIRDDITKILDSLQTEKFIRGYRINRRGKAYHSIEILLC